MKTIGVIGAGTMGNGIAQVFAQSGFDVHLVDIDSDALARARQTIAENLDRMCAKGRITAEEKAATCSRIASFTDLSAGIERVDLAVEAVTEDFDLKCEVFKRLDALTAADCILATNTSAISITKIAAVTRRPDKVIGLHFMNPVPLMKLIEVIRGYATSDETTRRIMDLSRAIHKVPVAVRDYPGFIANRILMLLINEAVYALHEGVAGVREIDAVMKLGMAHPMGPLQLADFIGLDVCHAILNVLYAGFKNPKYAPCPLLVNMVAAGQWGVKSGVGFYDYTESRKAERVSDRFR